MASSSDSQVKKQSSGMRTFLNFLIGLFAVVLAIEVASVSYTLIEQKVLERQEAELQHPSKTLKVDSKLLNEDPLSPTPYAQEHPDELAQYLSEQLSQVTAENMPDFVLSPEHSIEFIDSADFFYLDPADWENILNIAQQPDIQKVSLAPNYNSEVTMHITPADTDAGSKISDSDGDEQKLLEFLDQANVNKPVGVTSIKIDIQGSTPIPVIY